MDGHILVDIKVSENESLNFNQTTLPEWTSTALLGNVMATLLVISFELVGNFLLLCMILYEKFGMDPQKRRMTNQLLSSLCGVIIGFNILILPIVFINRTWDLPLPFGLSMLAYVGTLFFAYFCIFTFSQMVLFKFFYAVAFNKMAGFEDSFLSFILITLNCGLISILIVVRIIWKEYLTNTFFFNGRLKDQFDLHSSLRTFTGTVPIVICLTLSVLAAIGIGIKKLQMKIMVMKIPKQSVSLQNLSRQESPKDNESNHQNQSQEPDHEGQNQGILPKLIHVQQAPNALEEVVIVPANNEENPEPIEASEDNVDQPKIVYNNQAKNDEMINTTCLICLCIFSSVFFLLFVYHVRYTLPVANAFLCIYVCLCILCPALYFSKKTRGIKIVLEDLGFI